MTQRRMPGGQGPARRAGSAPRGARATGRVATRELGARPERGAGRLAAAGRASESGRSASRPAAARRAAATGSAKRTAAPHTRRHTGRIAVMVVVLIALALAYTYPVRLYLTQESDIARMEAAQAAQKQRIAELTELVQKWQDPEFVKTQARRRFYYVYPDEAPLIVLYDRDGAARDAGTNAASQDTPAPDRWYDTMWSSIQEANK